MDSDMLWDFFWRTGLPEAYTLRGLLQEAREQTEKSA